MTDLETQGEGDLRESTHVNLTKGYLRTPNVATRPGENRTLPPRE